MAAITDTSRTSPLSTIQLQDTDEIKRVFNRFDVNGDGKISGDELTNVLQTIGSVTSPSEITKMMEEIDTDRDGFINLDEFAGFIAAGTENIDGELKEAFELYDMNRNGLISSSELHQILTKLGEMCTEEDCVRMIQTVDSDGDGFVSFDEFKSMMSKSTNQNNNNNNNNNSDN